MFELLVKAWRWWITGLSYLVPEQLRRRVRGQSDRLIAELHPQALHLRLEGGRSSETAQEASLELTEGPESRRSVQAWLAQHLHEHATVILRLPSHQALRRTLNLPLSAADKLRQVLSFEIERQTPFASDQVYFDFHIASTDRAAKRLSVELAVAPRQHVQEAVARLESYGLHPQIVDLEGMNFPSRPINLLPAAGNRPTTRGRLSLNYALFGLLLVLAACLLLAPVYQSDATLERTLAELRRFKKEFSEYQSLLERQDKLVEEVEFFARRRRSRPLAIDLLAEVTRLLPDDSWTYRFEIEGGAVKIQGESANASELIGLLESSELFEGVSFISPVTRNNATAKDRFYIKAPLVAGNRR